MFNEIFVGGILALISGVSWFAYKHPTTYKAILYYIFILITPIAGFMIHHITDPYYTLKGKSNYLLSENKQELVVTADELFKMVQNYESAFKLGFILIAISLYLLFLRFLPSLIKSTENKSKESVDS